MLSIQGNDFKRMALGGAKLLEINRGAVDSLNVFPVPDGDTGTNMSLTMSSAVKEINAVTSDKLAELASAFSKGALRGARGNSGVITSQILKGFAIICAEKEELDCKAFAQVLTKGTEIAYAAVTRPKEGTILTVIRAMAEKAQSLTSRRKKQLDILPFFEQVLAYGEEILAKTPDMLPVLKKAGVVDAGGKGLLFIFRGMYNVLAGVEIPDEVEEASSTTVTPVETFTADDHEHINFSYCTEFFVIHLRTKVTIADIDKMRDFLMTIGDCVIVIGDLELIKVHVHTNRPDLALKNALKLGELDSVKVENMVEQNRAVNEKQESKKAADEPQKEVGMISICSGKGMENIFKDLGVDVVVEGGQTMNPSVYDILTAINAVNAKNVFIFPNNKNIILAAEQAKGLSDKTVNVVPTVNVAQGISAVVSFMPETPVEDNVEAMKSAYAHVVCGQVTTAVRTTRINGFTVREGDIIGLDDKKIVAKGQSVNEVVKHTIEKLRTPDSCVISLYYGEDITEDAAVALVAELQEAFPDYEILMQNGGQPHYFYILSIE
jgi:DAK2 domain fusion protein YloV